MGSSGDDDKGDYSNDWPSKKAKKVTQKDNADIDSYASASVDQSVFQNAQVLKQANDVVNERRDGPVCKCKKSDCFILFGKCIASNVHCLPSCTYQNCKNNKDYIVFDSKLVKNVATPTRYKAVCCCSKCKCVNNYCICYKAKDGCFGCGCNGCENPYNEKSDVNNMHISSVVTPASGSGSQQNVSNELPF